jgi:signal transduction histidine kinase
LVDDDEDDYVIVRDLLEKIERGRFRLSWEPTYERGLAAIAGREHEVYLLDYFLGDRSGLELVREALGSGCTAPLVLLTGRANGNVDLEAIKAGAADFLLKDRLDAVSLEHSLRYAVERRKLEVSLRRKEEQLRRARRLESLGMLAGGIAHEFNNLLQAILGCTRYAIKGLSPDDCRQQDLGQAVKAAERAAELTRQLLGFSRRQDLQCTNVDLNQAVSDALKMIRPLLGENIEIDVLLGEQIGTMDGDPVSIQQMLINLCINARDAMPCGGRLLVKTEHVVPCEADCRTQLGPGQYVLLTVADTGCGMTPEVEEHLFEPFFTTKPVDQGTGLGLPMVYGVVQEHGGSIDVQSEPNHGTTFRVYFPITTTT